jgi:hypothetical protein
MIGVLALVAACAEAGGETKGGELTDAGLQASANGVFRPPAVDGGIDCGEGTTWSSLYRDIFGPTGKPGSCSFQSNCHGSPEGDGAIAGSGIDCFDQNGCRQSMIDAGLLKPRLARDPDSGGLVSILRRRTPDGEVNGLMPKSPGSYTYPEACLVRIRGWISNNYPAD